MDEIETFKTVERPSYLGKKRDSFVNEMGMKYGNDNWRFAWKVNGQYLTFDHAIFLYESAYLVEIYKNIKHWESTFLLYSECYDNDVSNIKSGLDYTKQETGSNHYQDISVRRVMLSLGLRFGNESNPLMHIRHNSGDNGAALSPGNVPFHRPELIEKPQLLGWWNLGTVESFWQSNKFIQVKQQSRMY